MAKYIVFWTLFVVGLFAVGFGVLSVNQDYRDEFLQKYYSENSQSYSDEYRESFMESCMDENPELEVYCNCVHEGVIKLGVYSKQPNEIIEFFSSSDVKKLQKDCLN